MKILHIIESLEIGGAEMVLVNLANELSKVEDVAIYCVKKIGPLQEKLESSIPTYCLYKKEGNDIRTPLKIAALVRKRGFDVVHTHNWGVFFDSVVGAYLGGAKVIIHTAHGNFLSYPQTLTGKTKKFIRRIMDIFASRLLNELVTVSLFIKSQIAEYLKITPAKINTIYNGIPFPELGEKIEGDKEIEKDCIVISSVGRLAQVKNYPMLLRAFSSVKESVSRPVKLWLIGDGPERACLETLADKLKIAKDVYFWGFQENPRAILSQSDVFVLPSHYEGVSMALLEAMAAGLPVIATQVGGNAEVVLHGKTGILIPDNDLNQCANAILDLVANQQLRHDLGKEAANRVDELFSLDTMVKKYLQVYSTHL